MASSSKKREFPTPSFGSVDLLLGVPDVEDRQDTKLPLSKIHRTQKFGRCRYYDPIDLQSFAEEIDADGGVRSPIWVRPMPNGNADEFELVAGNRRYLASEIAGHPDIPVLIFDWADGQAHRAAAIENSHRALNRGEELYSVLNWMPDELGISQDEFLKRLNRMVNETKGKVKGESTQRMLGNSEGNQIEALFRQFNRMSWKSFVSKWLPILKWPEEILQAMNAGKISYEKAEAIFRVKDDGQRRDLLESAIADSLPLEEIKQRVVTLKACGQPQEKSFKTEVGEVLTRLKKVNVESMPASKQKKLLRLTNEIASLLSDGESTDE